MSRQGLYHIHSQGILHLDLKPANILITTQGALKIGDFGLSTRSPRIDPAAILRGAGLGGDVPPGAAEKGWDREGDRDYMALETMNGNFGKSADIFRFVCSFLLFFLRVEIDLGLLSLFFFQFRTDGA